MILKRKSDPNRPPLAPKLIEEHFGQTGGVLEIGGCRVDEIAEQYGTPFYAYDAGLIRKQLSKLRNCIPDSVGVYYSVKANPNVEIIRCLVDQGTGAEIASGAEYLRARSAGCAPEKIIFAGPGKTEAELKLVVSEGIGEIHLESSEEIERLTKIASELDKKVQVSVRVNPSAAASGGAVRMGGQPSPFGFDEERVDEVVEELRKHPQLEIAGLHMFAGTQILDANVLLGQWKHAFGIAKKLADQTKLQISTIDLGGGLGLPYFQNDDALDLGVLKAGAEELFSEIRADSDLEKTKVVLEPGRFLVGNSGIYVTRVLTVKESRGAIFVVLDGGLSQHLTASGNLGQIIKKNYPFVNASRVDQPDAIVATLCGPLCTPLDTVGRKAKLATTKTDDLVAILQSGAYGLSASPVGFLSHPMPAEVLVDDGESRSIRARGSFEQPIVSLP